MLSACSYVYADKFTACIQIVRLLNACTHVLSRTRRWSMDTSMTSCSVVLQTFSRRCRSSCVRLYPEREKREACVQYVYKTWPSWIGEY